MMATERSSSRRRVDFLTLPYDLLQKILLLLPVETLVCLASTCKKWRDYLLDDDFARLHLDRWRSRYGILSTSGGHYPDLVYSPIFDGSANKIILARLNDCFSRILKEGDYFRVLDSCDGLLLIVCDYYDDRKSRLVVCNPLMKSFKFLQHPPPPRYKSNDYNVVLNCHWKMVYDASIKRYKIIGITIHKVITSMKDEVIISKGRRFFIFELCKSSSESSEWKEVCVCNDELGGGDFGGQVAISLLVEERNNNKKKKKLYYLTYNDISPVSDIRTSLIYIDIETHQVKAVAAAACSSTLLGGNLWVASSSTGKFYMSISYCLGSSEKFNLFVLEDLQNPIWKRRCVNGRNVFAGVIILPLAVVQDNGDDEEDKIFYEISGKIYEYQTGKELWREVSNNTGHHFTHFRQGYYHGYFSVPHLTSLMTI